MEIKEWNIAESEFERTHRLKQPFIVICGLSGSGSYTIRNNESHNIYGNDGEYIGRDQLIHDSRKLIMKCFLDGKIRFWINNNSRYKIEGYPGVCVIPHGKGVEYSGPINPD